MGCCGGARWDAGLAREENIYEIFLAAVRNAEAVPRFSQIFEHVFFHQLHFFEGTFLPFLPVSTFDLLLSPSHNAGLAMGQTLAKSAKLSAAAFGDSEDDADLATKLGDALEARDRETKRADAEAKRADRAEKELATLKKGSKGAKDGGNKKASKKEKKVRAIRLVQFQCSRCNIEECITLL